MNICVKVLRRIKKFDFRCPILILFSQILVNIFTPIGGRVIVHIFRYRNNKLKINFTNQNGLQDQI